MSTYSIGTRHHSATNMHVTCLYSCSKTDTEHSILYSFVEDHSKRLPFNNCSTTSHNVKNTLGFNLYGCALLRCELYI